MANGVENALAGIGIVVAEEDDLDRMLLGEEGVELQDAADKGEGDPLFEDVLLMFAEADNEYNGAPSQEAYDCVKLIRDRAKIKTRDFAEYDQAAFRQLVRNERGRELVGEAGIRRFDLIRWGNFAGVMRTTYNAYFTDVRCAGVTTASTYAAHIPGNIKDRHILFPIPNIELGVNPELKQNKLW